MTIPGTLVTLLGITVKGFAAPCNSCKGVASFFYPKSQGFVLASALVATNTNCLPAYVPVCQLVGYSINSVSQFSSWIRVSNSRRWRASVSASRCKAAASSTLS